MRVKQMTPHPKLFPRYPGRTPAVSPSRFANVLEDRLSATEATSFRASRNDAYSRLIPLSKGSAHIDTLQEVS